MPLSFVVYGIVSSLCVKAIPNIRDSTSQFASLLLVFNLIILLLGIQLGITNLPEPYWITYSSIFLGVFGVCYYATMKALWVYRTQSAGLTINPQLY